MTVPECFIYRLIIYGLNNLIIQNSRPFLAASIVAGVMQQFYLATLVHYLRGPRDNLRDVVLQPAINNVAFNLICSPARAHMSDHSLFGRNQHWSCNNPFSGQYSSFNTILLQMCKIFNNRIYFPGAKPVLISRPHIRFQVPRTIRNLKLVLYKLSNYLNICRRRSDLSGNRSSHLFYSHAHVHSLFNIFPISVFIVLFCVFVDCTRGKD